METFIYLPYGYSCPHCSTLFPSIFSSSMCNFPPSVTTPPTPDPLFEPRVAPARGARPASPAGSLITSTAPALTENGESGFEKGTKREKLLVRIPSNPWPPAEPGISRSIGDTPIRPSALATANNTGARRDAQLTDERVGGRAVSVCGAPGGGAGGGGCSRPSLGGVIWLVSCINVRRRVERRVLLYSEMLRAAKHFSKTLTEMYFF